MRNVIMLFIPILALAATSGEVKRELPKSKSHYMLLLPKDYDPKKSYEFVVALHGSGDRAESFMKGMQRRFENRSTILAVPESRDPRFWDTNDVPRVVETVEDVQRNFNVDRTKHTLLGWSAGCSFSFVVLAQKPEMFQRVAAFGHMVPDFVPEKQLALAAPRTAIFYSCGREDQRYQRWLTSLDKLRKMKFNVKSEELDKQGHTITDEQIDRAFAHFDSLNAPIAKKK